MDKIMNILVQSSDYYAPVAGVMLTSLFENNKDIGQITVYLMTSDMSGKNRGRFHMLAEQYQRKIEVIDAGKIDQMLMEASALTFRGSYATYYKLFAPSILPESIDRLLYLDADMLVLDSLSELYNCEFTVEEMLAMCQSIVTPHRYVRRLKGEGSYYIAAPILFDVKKWRETNAEKKIIRHLENVHSTYPFPDESLINLLFAKQIKRLPLRCGLVSVALLWRDWTLHKAIYKLEECYSKGEFEQALGNPALIHYAGPLLGVRPWYFNKFIPDIYWTGQREWKKYWEKSFWNDCPARKYRMSVRSIGILFCHQYLPLKLFANLYGYLYTNSMIRMLKQHGL